ncbi:hypothetical protein ZIOFF_007995 [Zingiber officinale]|uniref:Phytanoyl-CoA dioxygenase n=1 Tax=Zingiber officinale TaxID=94328 RepID=A0A8J5I5S3_ZINOF|nr:hypothetical protein ZIOFF_007995 [Zingiber officinale]
MGIAGNLTAEQLDFFNVNGYLVVESFSGSEEIKEMRDRMEELLNGFDGSYSSIFSTTNQQHTDAYFFESAEKISFFFEVLGTAWLSLSDLLGTSKFPSLNERDEDHVSVVTVVDCREKAFGDDGCLKQPKELSINKVGHALHELDPVFKKFSTSDKLLGMLFSLDYKKPVVIQSMYIFKQPGIGGEVTPHQDNSFLYTDPPSCTGLWLALEDATINNGCLWAIPGSHKNGLKRRFIRDENGVHFDEPSPSYDQKDFVPLEVKEGALVVIHGDLIHQSFENKSSKSRHALSLHVVETQEREWAKDNWIQRKVDPVPLYAR